MRQVKIPNLHFWPIFSTLLIASASNASQLVAIKSAPEFKPITNEKKVTCSKPNSICWFEQEGGEKFALWFETSVDHTANLRSLTKISIKRGKTGEVQTFALPGVSRVELNEPVRIYTTQLRKGGPSDLALFTNLSPHNGPLFYYFVFDEATKKFVMTKDEIPKLDFTKESNLFASDTRKEIKYELDASLNLKQKFSPNETGKTQK